MKNGFLFFLNFGNITMVARFLFVLTIIGMINFSVTDVMFWVCAAVCAVAFVLCLIPAPKDKHVMYAMQFFYEDFDKVLNVKFGVVNMEAVRYVKGFRQYGKMVLKRYIANKAVYPHPLIFATNRVHNDTFVYIGEQTLMSAKEPTYVKCNIKDEGFEIRGEISSENERVAYITVKCKEYPEGVTIIVENDFHYRSFLDLASGKEE